MCETSNGQCVGYSSVDDDGDGGGGGGPARYDNPNVANVCIRLSCI
jgi:hypothetical protein